MKSNRKAALALPAGTMLRSAGSGALYIITDDAPRFGGSSIFYRLRREGSSLPYGLKECCPAELAEKLHRAGGILAGADEAAQHALDAARGRLLREAEISQKIASVSGRAIPVLDAPETLLVFLPSAETDDAPVPSDAAPAGSLLLMRQISGTGLFLPDLLRECALPPQAEYPLRTGGQPSLHTIALILGQTLKALEIVHRAGFLYGDLQPENLFFCDARPAHGDIGFGALLDFGCARPLNKEKRTAPITDCIIFTTPGYAAPELLLENDGTLCLTPAADVYSAGRLLLYLLRGRTYCENWDGELHDRLITGESAQLTRILSAEAEKLGCDGETLRLLQRLLDRSLALPREDRYPDAAAMLPDAEALIRLTQPPQNRLALSFSTLAEGEFLGREAQLRAIDRAFRQGRKPVAVSGFAGMGKTELAIEYGRTYRRGTPFFVRCRKTVRKTITEAIADAFTGYSRQDIRGREKPEEQIYREVLHLLGQRSENDLLIIDNMDGDEGGFSSLAAEPAFRDLCALPLRLLVTTRSPVDGSIEADELPRPLLRQLLHRFDESLSAETADLLIDAVEGHTLTVELIGRTLKHTVPRISPDILLDKLKAGGLDDNALARVSTAKDRAGKMERIQGHLTALFQLAALSDYERNLLLWSAMLPLSGMDLQLYCKCLPFDQDTFAALVSRGFLRISSADIVTVHPLVRSIAWSSFLPGIKNPYTIVVTGNNIQLAEIITRAQRNISPDNSILQFTQLFAFAKVLWEQTDLSIVNNDEMQTAWREFDQSCTVASVARNKGVFAIAAASCLESIGCEGETLVFWWEQAVSALKIAEKSEDNDYRLLGECIWKLATAKQSGFTGEDPAEEKEILKLLHESGKALKKGCRQFKISYQPYEEALFLQEGQLLLQARRRNETDKFRKTVLHAAERTLRNMGDAAESPTYLQHVIPHPLEIRLFIAQSYFQLQQPKAAYLHARKVLCDALSLENHWYAREAYAFLAGIHCWHQDWESMLKLALQAAAVAEKTYVDIHGRETAFPLSKQIDSLQLCADACRQLGREEEAQAYTEQIRLLTERLKAFGGNA